MSADSSLTERIIGAAYSVHNTLGHGFLESVYQRALAIELRNLGIAYEIESPLSVYYRNELVGEYRADLIVERQVIVEIKAITTLDSIHEQQLVHYLHATGIELGLLINFGRSVVVRRKINSKNQR